MTNYEHFREQIERITRLGRRVAVNKDGRPQACCMTDCNDCMAFGKKESCYEIIDKWADAEYIGPTVDWAKVPVDAPILVSNNNVDWSTRHFAKYTNGKVYAWADGSTSYTIDRMFSWEYAKLANEN